MQKQHLQQTSSSISLHDYQNNQVLKLIKTHQLTYDEFSALKIIGEQWIEESVKARSVIPEDAFNLGVMFKIAS